MALEIYRQKMMDGNQGGVDGISSRPEGDHGVQPLAEFARRVSAIGGAERLGVTYRPDASTGPILDVAIQWKQLYSVFPDGASIVRDTLTRQYHQDLAKALFEQSGIAVFMEDVHPDYWPGRAEDQRTDLCDTPEAFDALIAEWTDPKKGERMITIPLPLANNTPNRLTS